MNVSHDQRKVLILGGYGTFGQRIARALAAAGYAVVINGRRAAPAEALVREMSEQHPEACLSMAVFDIHESLQAQLERIRPWLVIHTSGPFQSQSTDVAHQIIDAGCHYIDLADSRQYIKAMAGLNELALTRQVTAITGASTVPALSSAVLGWMQHTHGVTHFNAIRMGITPGQKTPRGLATTRAVLSYLGKPMDPWSASQQPRIGWMDLYAQSYPNLKRRLMSNCEAPDLDLLAEHFSLDELQFSAGMGSALLHLMMWLTAWLVRLGLPLRLERKAAALLACSHWFDWLGNDDGGMHILADGVTEEGQDIQLAWFLEAFGGCGPQIPAIPAIVLTDKIHQQILQPGVQACVSLLSLDEYLSALSGLDIKTTIRINRGTEQPDN